MEKLSMLPRNATNKQIDAGMTALGWKPDDWQKVEMNRMRATRKYGCNVARQNGKSYDAIWYAIERSVLFGDSGCICVHNDTLRTKLLMELESYLQNAKKMGLIDRILRGDDSRVIFKNGAVLAIRIRNPGFITGLTLDYLIVDEAQKALDKHINDARRVLRRSDLNFIAYVGTPQKDDEFKDAGMNYFQTMIESGEMGPSNRAAFPFITDELMEMKDIPWKELQRANPSWRRMPHYKSDIKEAWETEDRESFWIEVGAVPKLRAVEDVRKPPRFSLQDVEKFMTGKGSVATRFVVSIGITAESDLAYAAFNDGTRTEVGHRWEIPYGELHQIAEDIRSQARNFSQIRISGTERGKALAGMLKERNLGPKVKVTGMPEVSSNLNLLISQLEKGELFVRGDSKGETKTALSNFWIELNPRSGGILPVSTLKTEEALIVALANSAMDERLAARLKSLHRNVQPAEDESGETVKKRVRHAW